MKKILTILLLALPFIGFNQQGRNIDLNEVVITFIPVYCNTERYNPNLTNNGVAIIGTRINNQ